MIPVLCMQAQWPKFNVQYKQDMQNVKTQVVHIKLRKRIRNLNKLAQTTHKIYSELTKLDRLIAATPVGQAVRGHPGKTG